MEYFISSKAVYPSRYVLHQIHTLTRNPLFCLAYCSIGGIFSFCSLFIQLFYHNTKYSCRDTSRASSWFWTFHFKYFSLILIFIYSCCIHSMTLRHSLPKICIIFLFISKLPRNAERSACRQAENVSHSPVSVQQTRWFSFPKPCSSSDSGTNLFLPFLTKAMGVQGSLVIHKKQTRGEVSVRHFCSICCDWGKFCGLPTCLDGWSCHLLATACLDVPVLHHADRWCTEILHLYAEDHPALICLCPVWLPAVVFC